jgi:peptidoglycan/LPS O-acetylase OafA/YrhL
LRAIAVYLVVAFHAGSSVFAGGFVGVDVFFVLSGYLVTQLLLRDIAVGGAVRLGRFYARRFRRLLPAAFVALVATAAVYTVIASPLELSGVTGSFRAAFLYSTNWYFIGHSTSYFGAAGATNPVLHFWSLAVEEQFYLVWPLLLGGLFAGTRRFGVGQRRVVRIMVAIAMLASVVRALSLRTSNPEWAYYGSDARAYQLLAGASLALIPSLTVAKRFGRVLRAATVACLVVLLVIATSWIHLDAIERGVAVAAIALTLIAAIEVVDGGVVKRMLSMKSVVYLGKISYGTYLWHWIVILVLLKNFHLGTNATIATACVVATAMASLSFQVLEHPVRASQFLDRYRFGVIATGLGVSVLSALLVIPAILDRPLAAPTVQATTIGFTPVPANLDARSVMRDVNNSPWPHCLGRPVEKCTVVRGSGRSIFLLGDSHAWMLLPAFEAIARREHLTLSAMVNGYCPWERDLYAAAENIPAAVIRDCKAMKNDVYRRVIPALHPDVIVLIHQPYDDPTLPAVLAGPDGRVQATGQRGFYDLLESTARASLDALQAPGRAIVIIESLPTTAKNYDALGCIAKAKVLEQCRFVTSSGPTRLELFYRQMAKERQRLWSANFDTLECPFLPICDPVINHQIVRFDHGHITPGFARTLAPEIDSYLREIGVIPH